MNLTVMNVELLPYNDLTMTNLSDLEIIVQNFKLVKGLFKKNLLFQNWKCHAYSNGKRSTVPESLIITALETVFLPKKFTRKRVQEMGEVTLVTRKYC